MPRIFIWNDASTEPLKNVVILANFTTSSQSIVPDFPYTGNWVNLMDNSAVPVASTTAPITIEAGGFRIFGNAPALATSETGNVKNAVSLLITQNPVTNGTANIRYTNADNGTLAIYDLSGKLVKSVKTAKSNGDEAVSINGLKSGMYLIQLKSDKGVAVTKMVVK